MEEDKENCQSVRRWVKRIIEFHEVSLFCISKSSTRANENNRFSNVIGIVLASDQKFMIIIKSRKSAPVRNEQSPFHEDCAYSASSST